MHKIYKLDPARFFSTPGLAWQAALKKTKVRLDILTDLNVLLLVQKSITEGICHSVYRYAKANNKYMEDYIKIKNPHIFNIGRKITYMVGQYCKSSQQIILSGSKIL